MAVEAARDCLTGVDRADVRGVTLASTTLTAATSWHLFEKPLIRAGRRLELTVLPLRA